MSGLRGRVGIAESAIHGTGCFATVPFAAGEWIGSFTGPTVRADGTHVLWVSEDGRNWVGRRGTSLLRFLNHSDSPNAAFEGFDLYAVGPIQPGDEITIDYQPQ